MIGFFAKRFIKDSENTHLPAVRAAYGTLCGVAGIFLNLLLFACKLFAGLISGAISVVSDAFNNFMDAASSVITLIGFRMSEQKADKDHPFGHGRIEYLSGLFVSMIIVVVGFELATSSFDRILSPTSVAVSTATVVILASSIAVKGYMAFYNFRIGKRISSAAMTATARDSLSDCIATTGVLGCLIVSHLTRVDLDGFCGIFISVFILISGLRSLKETVDPLLGAPPSPEMVKKITGIVFAHDGVLGMHDLIIHDYGPGRTMISLHAEVDADADLLCTHDMIDNIERDLRTSLHCDAVIHMDPIAAHDEETLSLRERLAKEITGIDPGLTMHDFRVVKGPTHTNLIFDVVIPSQAPITDDALREEISLMVKAIDESYFAVVEIDHSYV